MKLRRFLFTFLLAFPLAALAQTGAKYGFNNVLNPPAIKDGTDISLGYLENIFGIVDGVLHGSGSQIMGQMFGMFNAAALVLAVIIVLYTTILTISNTAAEGSFLGQKYSSIWIPLRTVIGIALLVPKATGYSAIQIFMMWVIVQGIGAADSIWDAALKYLSSGGVIVQQSMAPQQNISNEAKKIYRVATCMYGIESALQTARNDLNSTNNSSGIGPLQNIVTQQNISPVPAFGPTVNVLNNNVCDPKQDSCFIPFPGKFPTSVAGATDYNQLTGVCGYVSINLSSDAKGSQAQENRMTKLIAAQQLIDSLSTGSRQTVSAKLTPSFNGANVQDITTDYTSYAGVSNRMFLNSAEDYQALVAPAERIKQQAEANKQAWMKQSQKEGWITAGSYYQNLVNMNRSFQNQNFANTPTVVDINQLAACLNGDDSCTARPSPTGGGKNKSISQIMSDLMPASKAPAFGNQVKKFVITGTETVNQSNEKANNNFNKFIGLAPETDPQYGGRQSPSKYGSLSVGGSSASGLLSSLLPIVGPIVNVVVQFKSLEHAQQNGINPVVVLAGIGSSLMNLVIQIYIIGTIVITATTAGLASVPFMGLGTIVGAVVAFLSPLILTLSVILFVNGAIYAYYIPLIPFIIFLFGAIGWMMQVIESMVAAPIVALGITHPEGSEILGKADPAVLILVNVFLRPSMMIIGLIASIILSYVSIWLLNRGFFTVFNATVKNNVSGFALVFYYAALATIYTFLVVAVLTRVFDLINQIPDKVMTWIGGQGFGVGEQAKQAVGEVRGGLEKGAKGAAKGMQSGMQQGGKAAGEALKKKGEGDSAQGKGGKEEEGTQLPGEESELLGTESTPLKEDEEVDLPGNENEDDDGIGLPGNENDKEDGSKKPETKEEKRNPNDDVELP